MWVDSFVTRCGAPAGNYGTHLAKATQLLRAAKAAPVPSVETHVGLEHGPEGREHAGVLPQRNGWADVGAGLALDARPGQAVRQDTTRSGRWTGTVADKQVHIEDNGQPLTPTSVASSSWSASSSSGVEVRAKSRELQESAAKQLGEAEALGKRMTRPEFPCKEVFHNVATGTMRRASSDGGAARVPRSSNPAFESRTRI